MDKYVLLKNLIIELHNGLLKISCYYDLSLIWKLSHGMEKKKFLCDAIWHVFYPTYAYVLCIELICCMCCLHCEIWKLTSMMAVAANPKHAFHDWDLKWDIPKAYIINAVEKMQNTNLYNINALSVFFCQDTGHWQTPTS